MHDETFAASCAAGVVHWTRLDDAIDLPADATGTAAATISLLVGGDEVLMDSSSSSALAHKIPDTHDIEKTLGALDTEAALRVRVETSATPDGDMTATVSVAPVYECRSK